MSRTTHRLLSSALGLALAAHLLLAGAGPARAQFFDESLEQEDLFVEEEDVFLEAPEEGGAAVEPDFTEGERFVDEALVPAEQRLGATAAGRELQLTLGRERATLPINIAWGAGTGLLIGGWFALIGEGDNRETQRSIGLGIVAGIILGVVVGTRTVFNPESAQPAAQIDPPSPSGDGPQVSPLVALEPGQARVGFRLTF